MTNVLQAPPGKAQTSWHFWHFTTLFGHFMAAAAAGRLLKLKTRQMLDALGLAYHQASGNMQVIREGALAKRLGPGFASRAGVEAALMAQADISGAKDFIEGEVNFYKLYHSTCEYIDLSQLTAGLGTKFENANVSLKPYPCGVVNHTAIEAALALAVENDIRPAEVVKITVHTGAGSHVLCRPIDVKRHPKNAVDTQFSIPWSVATAIAKRKAAIEDYTAEATGDNVVNDLTDKLEAQIEPSFSGGTIEPARVTVILKNGKQLMKQVDHPSGSPEKPFSPDEVKRKFENCNSVSRKPLTTREIEKLTAMVARLEDVADISDLTEMLN
jgi:2-methylcitrate dehydratase PrpD